MAMKIISPNSSLWGHRRGHLPLTMAENKYLSALIQTQLIYDDDVIVPKTDVNAQPGPGTQFKEAFGLGFAYKFDGVKVK